MRTEEKLDVLEAGMNFLILLTMRYQLIDGLQIPTLQMLIYMVLLPEVGQVHFKFSIDSQLNFPGPTGDNVRVTRIKIKGNGSSGWNADPVVFHNEPFYLYTL